jgi:hypothetical protein
MTPKLTFEKVEFLKPETYTPVLANELSQHLEKVNRYYQQKQNKAISVLDEEVENLAKELGSKEALIDLKKRYYNDFLATLVLNRQEMEKIHDLGDHFVQLAEPIYKDPESHIGRAHFYAPVKQLGSWQIDTYWFNFVIIWLFSILLYITLITDALRKLIERLSPSGQN